MECPAQSSFRIRKDMCKYAVEGICARYVAAQLYKERLHPLVVYQRREEQVYKHIRDVDPHTHLCVWMSVHGISVEPVHRDGHHNKSEVDHEEEKRRLKSKRAIVTDPEDVLIPASYEEEDK